MCSFATFSSFGLFIGFFGLSVLMGFLVGLGDERTLKNLADRYAEYKGFDTGIFGTVVTRGWISSLRCVKRHYLMIHGTQVIDLTEA